ncbi:MAG: hypothetical protein IJE55_00300, partial [Clostridia bacterium]|nr:hypothetical protein [Clostridia bacterium]
MCKTVTGVYIAVEIESFHNLSPVDSFVNYIILPFACFGNILLKNVAEYLAAPSVILKECEEYFLKFAKSSFAVPGMTISEIRSCHLPFFIL